MSGLLKAQTIFGAFRSLEHGDLEKNFFRHFKTLNIFNFDELRISLDFSRLLSAFWKLKYFRTSKKKIQTCIIQNIFRTFYDGIFFSFFFFFSFLRHVGTKSLLGIFKVSGLGIFLVPSSFRIFSGRGCQTELQALKRGSIDYQTDETDCYFRRYNCTLLVTLTCFLHVYVPHAVIPN